MRHVAAKKRRRWDTPSDINIVWCGNSLIAGQPVNYAGGFPKFLTDTSYPIMGAGYTNAGVGGQTTQNMIDNQSAVNAGFVPGKFNILCAQEVTNQSGVSDYAQCVALIKTFVSQQKAANAWNRILLGLPPPLYVGDQSAQSVTDLQNAVIDNCCRQLRREWPSFVDDLVDTRQPGSPYDQARYPNYLKATFFDNTVINGISNNASWYTEGGGTPNQKIHPSRDGIRLLAPLWRDAIMRLGP